MAYLVGTGLTLVVLLGCLPLLHAQNESPAEPSTMSTEPEAPQLTTSEPCLLYTSDAADD